MVGKALSSRRPELSWDEINAILTPKVKYKSFMVRENFGFLGLDSLFNLVEAYEGFHKIISAMPSKFPPIIVNSFFFN